MFNEKQRPKKRLFLALILGSLAVLSAVIYIVWKMMIPGLYSISESLPMIVGTIIIFTITFGIFLFFLTILTVMGIPLFKIFRPLAWSLVILLFPLAVFLGKLLKIKKERIERSFIEFSNHLFRQKQLIVPAEKILLLLPHCLQLDTCIYKITQDVTNCKQCGRCCIGSLLAVCKKYNVHMAVVPGGTLARRVVMQLRPKVVLAVACERDLTSGIQDVFPLPVFGVLNRRPQGPCFNTVVDANVVEQAILSLIGKGDVDETKS